MPNAAESQIQQGVSLSESVKEQAEAEDSISTWNKWLLK